MKPKTLLSAFLLAASALGFSQTLISGSGYENASPVTFGGAISNVLSGKGVLLTLPNPQAALRLNLPSGTNWSAYTHLQIGVQNMSAKPQLVFLAIASTGVWCYSEILLSPKEHSRLIVPLDGMPSNGLLPPQPLGNSYAQIYSRIPVDKPHVSWLWIQAPNQTDSTQVLINDLKPVTAVLPTGRYVDRYGQQESFLWKGKIRSDSDLATYVGARTVSGVSPVPLDSFGGVTGTSGQTQVFGKWHTEKQSGKWYIIDPAGNRFFSSGVITAGGSSPAYVTGHESAFVDGALPSQSGPYAEHYETTTFGTGVPTLTYNFYTSNLQRRLGSNWRALHLQESIDRMRSWAFNTGGDGTNLDLARSQQVALTETVPVGGNFAKIWDAGEGAWIPDVFDPAWATQVENCLRPRVQYNSSNPKFVGLFVDNEQPWAYPYGFPNERFGMIQNIFNCGSSQPAKIAFVNWLKQRYGNNIVSLNLAWLGNIASFDWILNNQYQLPQSISNGMGQDLSDFMLYYGRTYFGTIRQKLTALNFNGLYLGCRFRFFPNEMALAAKEYCDVVSFNAYDTVPTDHHEFLKALDAPVMISEVGVGACDLGRIAMYPNLLSENDRAWYFKRYLSDALTFDNLVGLHYYQWEDNVPSGRYFDLHNGASGIVSITDVPYWPMIDVLTWGNTQFQNRLLTP